LRASLFIISTENCASVVHQAEAHLREQLLDGDMTARIHRMDSRPDPGAASAERKHSRRNSWNPPAMASCPKHNLSRMPKMLRRTVYMIPTRRRRLLRGIQNKGN
ncbi:MAG: hypothetical protein IJA71_10075, partial [Clostridia bacterium]|nr:hypothetical protein [Clostridia bacterium]